MKEYSGKIFFAYSTVHIFLYIYYYYLFIIIFIICLFDNGLVLLCLNNQDA